MTSGCAPSSGAFWEANKLYDQSGWNYKNVPSCTTDDPAGTGGNAGCFSNIGTAPGATVVNPGVQPDHLSFYQDTVRETKQTAFFASVDFDIIPKVLTITGGTRHFRFQNSSAGSVTGSFGCFEQGVPAGGCLIDNFNLNQQNLRDTESGFKSRGNITWHITPDTMVYYTFSQGFRPGRLQPERRCRARHRPGRRSPVPGPQLLSVGQADQQRDRLEDGIPGSPPAVERRHLQGELGQRPGGLLQSRAWWATSSTTPTARTSTSRESRLR